jgi:hypothetical protein
VFGFASIFNDTLTIYAVQSVASMAVSGIQRVRIWARSFE